MALLVRFDLTSFSRFLWQTSEGTFRRVELNEFNEREAFTFKKWLENLRYKIMNYQGINEKIVREQRKIAYYSNKPGFSDHLDLMEINKFSQEEVKIARIIFESVSNLFGHFTVRLAFGNMLNYFTDNGGVKILIMQRPALNTREYDSGKVAETLPSMLNHIGIKLATGRYEGEDIIRIVPSVKEQHLFSILFLNNKIQLDLIGGGSKDVSFVFGPLIGVGNMIKNIPRRFSKDLSSSFKEGFDAYLIGHPFEDEAYLETEFIKSQDILYDFIKRKIETKIISGNYLGGRAENRDFFSKVMKELRTKMYQTLYSKKAQSFSRFIELCFFKEERLEVSPYLKSPVLKLSFSEIDPLTRANFEIYLEKSEILNLEYKTFGRPEDLNSISKDVTKSALKKPLEQIIKHLKDDVIRKSSLGNGKVRIFPIVRVESKGVNYGYQYLVPKETATGINKKALKYLPFLPKRTSYFDIDLTTPGSINYRNSMYSLEHIALTMLADFIPIDVGFVIKEAGASIDDQDIFCALDRDGYFQLREIFSDETGGNELRGHNGYLNYPVQFDSIAYIGDNIDWDDIVVSNLPLRSQSVGSVYTDYLIYIKTSGDLRAQVLRESALAPFEYNLPKNLKNQKFFISRDFPFFL